uniref:Sigma B n=1 Tax=Mahlapitsi orthoreovirus TaxID=2170064 RepID=A0A3G1DHM7_9REOV|nr:Sigma B [Mahlapitsi orthoreovirus]
MEVSPLLQHSIAEAIRDAYVDLTPSYSAQYGWITDEFHFPDVIKVGKAYACTRCCGVLNYGSHYGKLPFPHHKCRNTYHVDDSPLLTLVRISRTTRHLYDAFIASFEAAIKATIKEDPNNGQAEGKDFWTEVQDAPLPSDWQNAKPPVQSHDLVLKIDNDLTSSKVDVCDFWMRPFVTHKIGDEVVPARVYLRKLIDATVDRMKKTHIYMGVVLPCLYKPPKRAPMTITAYDLAMRTLCRGPYDFSATTYKFSDKELPNWIGHAGATQTVFNAASIWIPPLAGNVLMFMESLAEKASLPHPVLPYKQMMKPFVTFLHAVYKGWPKDRVQVACPRGIHEHQATFNAQSHWFLFSRERKECETSQRIQPETKVRPANSGAYHFNVSKINVGTDRE